MARIRVNQTVTTRMRVNKMHVGMHPCPNCKGVGMVKNVGRGAKKG